MKPALLVRRTLARGEDGRGWVVGQSTKSGKGRRVRLTRRATAALKVHRKRQIEEQMLAKPGQGLWRNLDLAFPTETGSLFNPSSLRNRSFKRIKARSGVRDDLRSRPTAHLRHAAVERRRQREGGLRDAGTLFHNHHPQHLFPCPARHAGHRCRRHGVGARCHLVKTYPVHTRFSRSSLRSSSRSCSPGLQYGCSKRDGKPLPSHSLHLQNIGICRYFRSGRCWVRTSDLLIVRGVNTPLIPLSMRYLLRC